tara:strand:- start:338 stop:937 length:600 start_codon:yes stop_codon:yes gene_type:complete
LYNHDHANGFAGVWASGTGFEGGTNGRMECSNDASICLSMQFNSGSGVILSTDKGMTWTKITDKGALTTRSDNGFLDVAVSGDGMKWGYCVLFGYIYIASDIVISSTDSTKFGLVVRSTIVTEDCDDANIYTCSSCPIGQFNNEIGQSQCKSCREFNLYNLLQFKIYYISIKLFTFSLSFLSSRSWFNSNRICCMFTFF